MAVPCQCGPQKCIIAFEKFILFWVPMNIQKDWKAKLESAYSFMLKYSKAITLCANQIICFSQRTLHPLHSLLLSTTLAESSQLMQDSSTCSTWFYSVRYNCVLRCEVSSIKTGGIKAQGPFSYRKVHNFNEKTPHN